MPDWLVAACQLALWFLLSAAAIHLLRSAVHAWRGLPRSPAPEKLANAPMVTVQLPICNERFVVERIIRAACALDWPTDRIEVQVLDDSDDDTRQVVDRTVKDARARGITIS